MAYGFESYSKPKTGSLGKYLAGKIGKAAGMAADERKKRDEEVKSLKEKQEALKASGEKLSDEEQERLDFLTEQQGGRKGSFFGKALMAEFGGDRARRLKGTFSKDPSKENDPSLSKEERFSALLDKPEQVEPEATVEPQSPYTQLELPLGGESQGTPVEDPGLTEGIQKIFGSILESYDKIADKVSALASVEKEQISKDSQSSKFLTGISDGLRSIKGYFVRDNSLKKDELSNESQQLELELDKIQDAKAAAEESDLEKTTNGAGGMGYDNPYGAGGGLLGKMFGGIMDAIGGLWDRVTDGVDTPSRRRRRDRSRTSDPNGKNRRSSSPDSPKSSKPRTPDPGKRRGFSLPFGRRRFKASEGAVVPGSGSKNVTPLKKLAPGGIYDNPTVTSLNPGDAVIPLNRNNALGDLFKGASSGVGKETTQPLAQVMQLPSQVGGGLMLSLLSHSMKKLGGLTQIIKPIITKIANPLAAMFGLPATVIGSIFGGGSAKAGTLDLNKLMKGGGGSGGEGGGGDGGGGGDDNPPGGTPESLMDDIEADIGKDASGMESEIMSSGAGGIVNPTKQPWCAAYVNSQLKRNGIEGSGSAAADSFENWGAKVDKNNIQRGDIIVGDYGGGSRSHVMFAAGSPKDGYVDVIGGNQSGKVTRGTIALNKIDYARRAGASNSTTPTSPSNPPPKGGPKNLSTQDQRLFSMGGGLTAMSRDNKTVQQVIAQGRAIDTKQKAGTSILLNGLNTPADKPSSQPIGQPMAFSLNNPSMFSQYYTHTY